MNITSRFKSLLRLFQTRLGVRLAAMFILVALIPMVAAITPGYRRTRETLVDLALSKVEQEATLTAKDMQTYLEQFSTDVLALSKSPPVQGIIRARDSEGIDPLTSESYESWIDRLRQIFATTARSKKFYQSLNYIDEAGDEIVRVEYREGKVTVFSRDTRLEVGTLLQNRADADYFVEASDLAADEVYVSPVILNRVDGEIEPPVPILHFSTPVYDRSRNFRGVIVSSVYATSFLGRLDVDQGEIYLADEAGAYLVHPDSDRTFGFDQSDDNVAVDFSDTYRALIRSGDDAFTALDEHRSEVVALQKLHFDPRQPQRYWLLIRTLPENDVLGPVKGLGALMLGGALILTFVVGFLALRLARGFTHPIIRLTGVAEQISRRELPQLVESMGRVAAGESVTVHPLEAQSIPVTSKDEVGRLARAFNRMIASLQEAQPRLLKTQEQLRSQNEMLSRRAAQLQTSSQVGRQATSILDLDRLLDQVVDLIQTRFGYYLVSIWLVADREDAVILHAGRGAADHRSLKQRPRIPLDASSIIAQVCQTGSHYLADDVSESPEYVSIEGWPDARSELALPLRMGEEVIGVLDIRSDQREAFAVGDRMALQVLADQVAIAIRNARLYESEQYRRQVAESLEQIGRVLTSSLNLGEVTGQILDQLAVVVPYRRGVVFLKREGGLQAVARRVFPSGGVAPDLQVAITEGGVFQKAMNARDPVIVDDVTRERGWEQLGGFQVDKSWLGVPLVSQDRVIGLISLTRSEVAAFIPEDAKLVSAFAAQAAIALENAHLYDEISRFNVQLEQKVRERTRELDRAYRTLERLDKTKSDFIKVSSHELRTPITVVKMCAQMLALNSKLQCDPELSETVQGILSGVQRLHSIVNDMLEITKIDSHLLEKCPEETALQDVILKVRLGFKAALQERRLDLDLVGLDSLPAVRADPDLLFKVFYHLIMNAIKYTPDGGRITVTGLETTTEDGEPAVEVVVSDTGIGIAPEHHELIFEKFYQTGEVALHSSGQTKFKGGGPGLGLAVARGIVLAHNGRIWVESEKCDEEACPGSDFHVRLPVS